MKTCYYKATFRCRRVEHEFNASCVIRAKRPIDTVQDKESIEKHCRAVKNCDEVHLVALEETEMLDWFSVPIKK